MSDLVRSASDSVPPDRHLAGVDSCIEVAVCYNGDVLSHNAHQFAVELARIAEDTKCEDVVALDLRGITAISEFVVIATGTSGRQIRAVGEAVRKYGKKLGQVPYGYAGHENAVWLVVDYVDVVFHVFGKPYRSFYDLELLWGDAPRLSWARSESA